MVEKTTLAGRYHLDERIAGGGMGTIFVATDELLGRRVAAKLLREDLADNPAFVERFRREARAVASLVHPNIATIYDYGEDDGRRFIVMELIAGRDLESILRREGSLEPERARRLGAEVCRALGHAHAAGLVHRDVKPANVIVTPEDHVKVTDFGIARAVGDSTMTVAGSVLGTAQYMSPEQASDQEVGPASDVYSMGIMLYQMLTGELPFAGTSPVAIAMRHLNEAVPSPRSRDDRIPEDLDRIVARATDKAPERRFRDGAAMAHALAGGTGAARTQALAGGGAAAPMPATTPTKVYAAPASHTDELEAAEWPPAAPPRRRRRLLGPTVALLLVLLALGAGALAAITLLPDGRAPSAAPVQRTPSPTPTPPEEITVPSGLVGGDVAAAEAALADAGLRSERRDVPHEAAEGTVLATEPPEGTALAAGDTVTLIVSAGPPLADEETPPGQDGTPGPPEQPPGQDKQDDEGDEG